MALEKTVCSSQLERLKVTSSHTGGSALPSSLNKEGHLEQAVFCSDTLTITHMTGIQIVTQTTQ